jgi:hypothetical protein
MVKFNNFDKKIIFKKWIPIIVIIFAVSSILGLSLGISLYQILSAIVLTLILITSAILFQMVGRNRLDNKDDKTGFSKYL